MTYRDSMYLSNNEVISFLLKNSLQDDFLFLKKRSIQNNSRMREYPPLSLKKALDVIRDNPNDADQVVWTIILQDRRGNSGSFLELIEWLQSKSQDGPALVLNTYALDINPNSGDLYATEMELLLHWADALSLRSIINEIIDKNYERCWTPRFCRAVCSFFWILAKDSSSDRSEILKRGIQCAKKLQEEDPTSEWGYYWELSLLWLSSPKEASSKLAEYVISARPESFAKFVDDSKAKLCCPRCCQMYIELILSRNPLLDWQIIKTAEKGMSDARSLFCQKLSHNEQKEIIELLKYFREKIEKMISSQKFAAELKKELPQEISISNASRENIINSHEKYKIRYDEED